MLAAIMDDTGTTRFELLAELGKGGMGVVYDAYDRERDMRVALKKLRNVGAASVYRFKREFRALRDLSHPNIVELYELVADGDDWYLTMERIEGQDIIAYVHELRSMESADTASAASVWPAARPESEDTPETPSGTSGSAETLDAPPIGMLGTGLPVPPKSRPDVEFIVDIERLRDCLQQLAHALYALHSAGMVHRDLKPSNVMVTREGRVVLMDFGIVSELLRPRDPVDGTRMIGTPSFMAPEQIAGGTPTAAADWYAFGTLLYVALTARLPFVGSVAEKLRAKRELDPWPPSTFVADIPPDLERLCMHLLAREPDARPRDRQILSKLGVTSKRLAFSSDSSFHGSDIFVGRAEELQILHEAYSAVDTGGTRCVVVHATSGMGKTSLLDRFVEDLRDGGRYERRPLVLTARCQETENLSYKAFDGVIDDLCSHLVALSDDQRGGLAELSSHALSRIFPVLRNVPGWKSAPKLDDLSPSELRSQASNALRAVLDEVARTQPVVMRIDDIHWADRDSLELLLGILEPPPPKNLMLIAAVLSDVYDDSTESALADMFATLEARRISRRIDLGPLFEHEQRALIKALAVQRGVFEEFDDKLTQESAGHPMLLAELVWYAMEAPSELAEATGLSLEGVLARRVSRLPESARLLLEVVAVAREPLPVFVLAEACGVSVMDRERALSILRINHLAHTVRKHEHERWLDVYHDKVRETILTYIPPLRARKLHRELARVLRQWPRAPRSSLARHSLAAGDTRHAAGYLVEAARDAVQALAVDRAAELFRAAGELMDDLSHHGEHDYELDVMRCRAWIGAVQTTRERQDMAQSMPILDLAHTIASRYQLDEELATIQGLRGHLLFAAGDLHAALREYESSFLHAQRSGRPATEAHAGSSLGHAHFMLGDTDRARRYYDNAMAVAERHELAGIAIAVLPTHGLTSYYRLDMAAALSDCRSALAQAKSLQLRRGILMARAALGFVLLENGQLDEARYQLYEAVDLAHRLRMDGIELALWSLIGKYLHNEGRSDEGIVLIERGLSGSTPAARRFAEPLALGALARLTGDPGTRTKALDRGREALAENPIAHSSLFFCRDAIDALFHAGDADGVDLYTAMLRAHPEVRELPWGQFMCTRGSALAAHLRDPDGPEQSSDLKRLRARAEEAGLLMLKRELDRALAE